MSSRRYCQRCNVIGQYDFVQLKHPVIQFHELDDPELVRVQLARASTTYADVPPHMLRTIVQFLPHQFRWDSLRIFDAGILTKETLDEVFLELVRKKTSGSIFFDRVTCHIGKHITTMIGKYNPQFSVSYTIWDKCKTIDP